MNIPKKKRGESTKTESLNKKRSQSYIVAESLMEDYVKHLRVRDSEKAIARLQAIADLTARALNEPDGKLEQSDLKLIRRLAGESKNKLYQEITRAMIAAVMQGPEGIRAANRTAARAVEIGFRWSIYYYGALEIYKGRLMSITPVSHNASSEPGDQDCCKAA